MYRKKKDLQKRYEGFLQTKTLWKTSLFGLHQFNLNTISQRITIDIDENQRLGKYVEELVFYQIEQTKDVKILEKNIQIQSDKLTIGEIDCLLSLPNETIHLEIVYKFYLYDETVGNTEIENCIGPNRKDSLIEKLTKLKEKQLPLLYSDECKPYLSDLYLDAKNINQKVYFKAQLFLPYSNQQIKLSILNEDCVVGYYINQIELMQFKDCKFYVPIKKDWLVLPHTKVNWINFSEFLLISNNFLERKFSPLVWIKKPNGEIGKLFLVWW